MSKLRGFWKELPEPKHCADATPPAYEGGTTPPAYSGGGKPPEYGGGGGGGGGGGSYGGGKPPAYGGGDVKWIQEALKKAGYDPGPIDGKWGPKTSKAVMAYQQANGLPVDGKVGPKTKAALGAGGGSGGGYKPPPGGGGYKPPPGGGGGYQPKEYPQVEKYPPGDGGGYDDIKGKVAAEEGGLSVSGAVYSGKTDTGADVTFLGGEAELREDGTVAGKGAVLDVKKGDEEAQILAGEFQVGPDGSFSAKGVVAKSKKDGVTNTVGEIEISDEKAAVVGAKKEIDFAEATGLLPKGVVAKADVAVGTASVEGSIRDDGISVGAQANVAEASVTLGTENDKSDRDETARVGLSEGVGLAGRVHFGDKDKDGNLEVGIGADFGPVSFDIKTEDPLRKAIELAVPAPLAPVVHLLDDGTNLTTQVLGTNTGEIMKEAKEFVAGVEQAIEQKTEEAKQEAKEFITGVGEGISNLLGGD